MLIHIFFGCRKGFFAVCTWRQMISWQKRLLRNPIDIEFFFHRLGCGRFKDYHSVRFGLQDVHTIIGFNQLFFVVWLKDILMFLKRRQSSAIKIYTFLVKVIKLFTTFAAQWLVTRREKDTHGDKEKLI